MGIETRTEFKQLKHTDMLVRASIIIMSHLSDSQHLLDYENSQEEVNTRLNFAKFLIMKFPDTTKEIDAEVEYEAFQEKSKQLKG